MAGAEAVAEAVAGGSGKSGGFGAARGAPD